MIRRSGLGDHYGGSGACSLHAGGTMFEGEIERGRTSYLHLGPSVQGIAQSLDGGYGLVYTANVVWFSRSSQTKQTPERFSVGRWRTSGVAQPTGLYRIISVCRRSGRKRLPVGEGLSGYLWCNLHWMMQRRNKTCCSLVDICRWRPNSRFTSKKFVNEKAKLCGPLTFSKSPFYENQTLLLTTCQTFEFKKITSGTYLSCLQNMTSIT